MKTPKIFLRTIGIYTCGITLALFSVNIAKANIEGAEGNSLPGKILVGDCDSLAKFAGPDTQFDRMFDPETGVLVVNADGRDFIVNIHDTRCTSSHEEVRRLVEDVLAVHQENLDEECAGIRAELKDLGADVVRKGGIIDSPKGRMDVGKLAIYADELCNTPPIVGP